MSDTRKPYFAFGALLSELRKKAGITHQSELAKLVGLAQQTVSRWESGISRPRGKQMPALASALNSDVDELLAAAGYSTQKVVATFDQPFPIDALNPESFERFCLYFLAKRYPDAGVHRMGKQGHTQDGLDVEVIFPDKTRYTFQCKRVQQFGPAKVHTAVAQHTRKADKKLLFLSRIASPKARAAVGEYEDWDIWDKEDISLETRGLPKNEQVKLVDIFFKGQHLALLGETEPGPWQTETDFFAPFMGEYSVFNHVWDLVGRDAEICRIAQDLTSPKVRLIFLVGTGGAGKSRVLKQAIEPYESGHQSMMVRFLSPTEEVTNKSLEDLGDRQKVLVVDDAHERSDLQLLFQFAADPSNKTKLLISLRPYGLDYIKAQSSSYSLVGDVVSEIKLGPLTLPQATQLAAQVLEKFGGPVRVAKDIARLTIDCPLATVIGAQVVAREKKHFELAKEEDVFRLTLLGKFQNVIAGQIGNKGDEEAIRKLLRVLALLQPFDPEDRAILQTVEKVEGLQLHEVNRFVRLLISAGVLFRREGKYRLSPDVLADYIIETVCIGESGKSTGYAEKVFEVASDAYLEHILLNLGKLDWRRANGDPTNSELLQGIWGKLQPSSEYADPHISAVAAVAFYQPARALDFAERLIRKGEYLRDLPRIIKNTAYNLKYARRACEYLWELGKQDDRPLNQHPYHAIRILSELCAVEPDKPIEYNKIVVDFCLSELEKDDISTAPYSHFDVLKGILQPEGHTTSSHGKTISFDRFRVNHKFVAPLRGKVIDALIGMLSQANAKIAVLAARCLHDALRYGMDASEEEREEWTEEFLQTLEKIENTIQSENIDPLTLIEIAHAVSWHTNYAKERTTAPAKRIIASLPTSLDFRTVLGLVDGHGHLFRRVADKKSQAEWNGFLETLAEELLAAHPDGEVLRAFIEERLAHIETNYANKNVSPYVLFWKIVRISPAVARATVEDALVRSGSKTKQFVGIALGQLLVDDHVNGLMMARQFLSTESPDLQVSIGMAYSDVVFRGKDYDQEDLSIVRKLLNSTNKLVVHSAIGAIRNVANTDKELALELIHEANIGLSDQLADDVLNIFHQDNIPFQSLSAKDIDLLLEKLMRLPELDGYWVETFLANVSLHHGTRGARFFMKRVEHAADNDDWQYRPCNYGPYGHVPLRFRESPEFGSILSMVVTWIRSRSEDDLHFHTRAGELFNVMFQSFDEELTGLLQDWVEVATSADIQIISHIIHEVPGDFVFQQLPFVVRLLERAKQLGAKSLKRAREALFWAAISRGRSGTVGEPFPEDIKLKEDAEKALVQIPRFSPAYELYDSLRQHAEHEIKRSLQEGERFED